MKIVVAGATGAIGRPLITRLIAKGHEVVGLTRSPGGAQFLHENKAQAAIIDVLDQASVEATIASMKPDAIIDMLTALPKAYTADDMKKAAQKNALVRISGGNNLLFAGQKAGIKRYISQSSAFWYAPGQDLADESVPFAFNATPGISAGCLEYQEIERRTLESLGIEGVALRFGFFYGPGTWYGHGGNMVSQVRQQQFPIIGNGQGVWSFVHIDDAAESIVSALTCTPGVYNICDDNPSEIRMWLPAYARWLKAPEPLTISAAEGERLSGLDSVYYHTKLRGALNAKAKREFGFHPRGLEWLS